MERLPDDIVKLLNMPAALTTPPDPPPVVLRSDGVALEYLLPFPVHLEEDDWAPLSIRMGEALLRVHKPRSGRTTVAAAETIGNQTTDLLYSVWMIESETRQMIDPFEGYLTIERCAQWLRVLGRQFWVFHGSTGIAAACRGSQFTTERNVASQYNFAGFRPLIPLRPFWKDAWKSIEAEVNADNSIPTADSVCCDGLNSLLIGDDTKALVELGIAAEVELTQLCNDAADANPSQPACQEFLGQQAARRDSFWWKMGHMAKMGLIDPASYQPQGGPPTWTTDLALLYQFRGGGAHSGKPSFVDHQTKVRRNLQPGDVQKFVFAVEALFHWSEVERVRLALPHRALQYTDFASRPIRCVAAPNEYFLLKAQTSRTSRAV